MSYSTNLALGSATRNDACIISWMAKKEVGKTETSIKSGDLLKVVTEDNESKIDKVSAVADCIYGVAGVGIVGFCVPVITSGHCLIDPLPAFTATVGMCLKDTTTSVVCCRHIVVVKKMTADKGDGTDIQGYEVKI